MEKATRRTARGLVVHGRALLLMERWRRDAKTGKERHYFSIPGGGIEPGETPEQAVVRELFEEMHILVRPLRMVGKQSDGGTQHIFFVCTYLSGAPNLHPGSPEAKRNHQDNRYQPAWVSHDDFQKIKLYPSYEPMRAKIEELFDGQGLV